jgi:DNA-binding response OmpR family regulator/HAMP domain-containing protein
MDTTRPKRNPWRSRADFTAWAQDFSLIQKVLGGFLGVVVLVGLATSLIGTRLAREMIMERSRSWLFSDLAAAAFVFKTHQESLELKIRLTASSEKLTEMASVRQVDAIRNRLALLAVENDLDYLTLTDAGGKPVVRALAPENKEEKPANDDILKAALAGEAASGIRTATAGSLAAENPGLLKQLGGDPSGKAMVIEAAKPLVVDNRVIGVLYGGVVLNNNRLVVDRIQQLVFKSPAYGEKEGGFVAIFHDDAAVSSSLKGDSGLPTTGFTMSPELGAVVLKEGKPEIVSETAFGARYLTAAAPLKDYAGSVIGAVQVSALEKPITSVTDRLVNMFLAVALLGVILMAGISYFLVRWINRPLQLMLHAARRAAEGDLSHEVPVIARDEIGELAATFNLMIRNLAESRERLEEWGRELSSKVAAQTGELDAALEQVARVKKLAGLEKMADGMAHIMAHISDPLVSLAGQDESGATSHILVLDHEESVLDVCGRIFESEGFEVRLARTVSEALTMLEEEFFDVVVMDIEMPDMDGRTLIKEIRYRQPEVSIILTAPFRATEQAVEAVKLGAFDYIPKPFGPHQILLMVYTAIQAKQTLDRTRREHASQRAEKIFQRLPVALALADKAHRVVYNNQAFVDLAAPGGEDSVRGKTFSEILGVDPLEIAKTWEEGAGSAWIELEKVGRTAKLYNFKLPEEDLRVLMLLDITDTVKKDSQANRFRAETLTRAQQVIHQQMRVAQEIAGLLGETTAETKAALFELIKLAKQVEGGR